MANYKKSSLSGIVALMVGILMLLTGFVAVAANQVNISPIGNWTTINDQTNKPNSIVQIWQHKGMLFGKVTKIYMQPGDTGYCNNCSGDLKNKPVKGMTIMWNLKRASEYRWSKGTILDPKIGKIYSCYLTVAPDGRTLKLRGYIGFSLLGRTQTWIRVAGKRA